ncbi:MAG TPA: acyltransferase [Polyangiaceae bacterium]|nr:acyltransferase [Polyangiaceae bacterium]
MKSSRARARVVETAPPQSRLIPGYFPSLDGLRFAACSGVILQHSFGDAVIAADVGHPLHNFVVDVGATGVDVFFSLSGFLITKLLLDEKSERGRVDLLAFYLRRTLRIWPVYYAALLLAFGGAALLGDRFLRPFGGHVTREFFEVALPAHLAFVGNVIGDERLPTSVATLWSICVEEQFYLLFPILFVFSKRPRPVVVPALSGIALSCAVRAWLVRTHGPIQHNLFAHADNLLAGALLAQALHASPRTLTAILSRHTAILEAIAVGALLAFNQWDAHRLDSVAEWVAFYLVSAAVTTFLVAVFALGRGPLGGLLADRRIRFLGRLTYAAYCFHTYAIVVVWVLLRRVRVTPWEMGALRTLAAVPIAMGIAYVVRITFEGWFLTLKRRFEMAGAHAE